MFYSGIADEAGTPIEEQIRAHKLLGWEHIEVRNVEGGNLCEVDDAIFEKTLAALGEAGIAISSFASGIANWARMIDQDFQRDVDDLKRAIPRMKKAGCPIIRIMSWPNSEKSPLPEAEWKAEALRRLRELTKIAEDGGIILGHENCSGWGGHSVQTITELLEEIQSPAFAIIYDTGNTVGHGGDPWDWYQACKDRTAYIHIKDGKKTTDSSEHYDYPGEGEGKVREILTDFFANGYDGGISIEPHLAAQVHLGTTAAGVCDAFETYVEYGRRLMKLVDEIKGA